MKRRRLGPDTRPDWRDPNCPCYYSDVPGDPKRRQKACQDRMRLMTRSWRNDPSYHWKENKGVDKTKVDDTGADDPGAG